MAKKPEQQTEEEELESIEVTIGPARGGSYALMSPINKGKSVNLRPSAETVAEMKRRGVTRVTASWDRSKKNGQVRQLTIRPANPGGGLKVRYDGNMRPCIHVPTRNMGTAVLDGSPICDGEKIDGDAFKFQVPSDFPFPDSGQQKKFHEQFGAIIASATEG
jgi:hypothetical protein